MSGQMLFAEEKLTFLVQRELSDGERINSIMSAVELGKYINMNDCYDENYEIFNVTEFGKVTPAYYKGWQPECVVEVFDGETGSTLFRYIGEDH